MCSKPWLERLTSFIWRDTVCHWTFAWYNGSMGQPLWCRFELQVCFTFKETRVYLQTAPDWYLFCDVEGLAACFLMEPHAAVRLSDDGVVWLLQPLFNNKNRQYMRVCCVVFSVVTLGRLIKCSDLRFLVKPGDVPLHHFLHAVVGVLFHSRPEQNKQKESPF